MMLLNQEFLEEQLKNEGYVVFPLLDEDVCNSLSDMIRAKLKLPATGLFASAHIPDLKVRKEISDLILSQIGFSVQSAIPGAKLLGATYMAKLQGNEGTLIPHRDWNIVDESLFSSYNLWIPLKAVDETNGTICILKKSHLLKATFRGPNLSDGIHGFSDFLWDSLTPIVLKAGDALLYDHKLIHASGPNKSPIPREVIVAGLIPRDAEMLICYRDEQGVSAYKTDSDFFLMNDPESGPASLLRVASLIERPPLFTLDDLWPLLSKTSREKARKSNNDNSDGLWRKIVSYFNSRKP